MVFALTLVGTLTGCIDGPHHAAVYVDPSPVYVRSDIVVYDDYVYYPSYQVYYSSRSSHYIYLEGSSWVTRPAPPNVSIDVLFASPSIAVDFHDAPSLHHAMIVETYPKTWSPPGQNRGNKVGHSERIAEPGREISRNEGPSESGRKVSHDESPSQSDRKSEHRGPPAGHKKGKKPKKD